jgi:hypothetical protein
MPSQNEDPIEFIQISTITKSKQECEDIATWPTFAFQDQGYIAVIEIAAQGYVAITKARSFMDVTEGDQPGSATIHVGGHVGIQSARIAMTLGISETKVDKVLKRSSACPPQRD